MMIKNLILEEIKRKQVDESLAVIGGIVAASAIAKQIPSINWKKHYGNLKLRLSGASKADLAEHDHNLHMPRGLAVSEYMNPNSTRVMRKHIFDHADAGTKSHIIKAHKNTIAEHGLDKNFEIGDEIHAHLKKSNPEEYQKIKDWYSNT